MGSLIELRRPGWAKLAAVAALALGSCLARPALATVPVVYYYPGSGLLQLNNTGADYDSTLGGLEIYVAASADLPSTLPALSDWTSNLFTTGANSGYYMNWDNNSTKPNDVLPQGIFTLAQLPAGLSTLSFGYSYSKTIPSIHVNIGSGDTSGAVEFTPIAGGSATPDIVYLQRVVPRRKRLDHRDQRVVEHGDQLGACRTPPVRARRRASRTPRWRARSRWIITRRPDRSGSTAPAPIRSRLARVRTR